jgi:hypothetical protein
MSVDISFFTEPPPAEPEPEPEPKGKSRKVEITTIKWDRKREKEHDASMKLAFRTINGNFRLPKVAPLSPADRKELRTIQQRERRASKALCDVII